MKYERKGREEMKAGALKKAGGLLMAAVLMLSLVPSAMAVESESIKEFRNGKTKAVVLESETTLVLQEDGSLWVQGETNWLGADGPHDPVKQNYRGAENYYFCTTPKKIMDGVAFVTATSRQVAVIKNDGSLWTAGHDSLSNGELISRTGFEQRLDNVKSVSINDRATFAVKNDGTLWAWGWGYIPIDEKTLPPDYLYGMGEGWEVRIMKPVQVMDHVASVSSAVDTTMILKDDGTLLAMGDKSSGYVGTGDLGTEADPFLTEPTPIMTDVKEVHCTFMGAYAIKNDSSLWMWGHLRYLDLNLPQQAKPIKVLDDVRSAEALSVGLLVLKTDGTLWALGPQENGGMLCDGGIAVSEAQRTLPRKCLLDSVAFIESYPTSAAAITSDGSLWLFGDSARYAWVQEEYTKKPVQVTGLSNPSREDAPTATPAEPTAIATPTASKILLDGKAVSLDAYNINSNNYCKIRDVAKLLNGTGKQFEVTWDKTLQAVSMTSNRAYTAVGGELAKGDGESKTATLNTAKIYLNGKEVALTAYNIGGNNYIKLRDLGQAFDFDVRWDGAASAIVVDTTKGYTG